MQIIREIIRAALLGAVCWGGEDVTRGGGGTGEQSVSSKPAFFYQQKVHTFNFITLTKIWKAVRDYVRLLDLFLICG